MNKEEKQKNFIEHVSKNNMEYTRVMTIIEYDMKGEIILEDEGEKASNEVIEVIKVLRILGYKVIYKDTFVSLAPLKCALGYTLTISWL